VRSVALIVKRAFWAIFLCLTIVSFPLPSLAVTVQDVPNPRQVYRGWVTDMANLLDSETKAKLNQIISKLEAENGTEIAVVTVPDTLTAPTPKQFATQLFHYWGIGKRGINNGVLFLISKDERRVEIETGYGIEKILPNTRIKEIIDQEIIPRFKQEDFAGGTLAGTTVLIKSLEGEDIFPNISRHQLSFEANIALFIFLGLAAVGVATMIGQLVKTFSPLVVEPEGRVRIAVPGTEAGLCCANCRQWMKKLSLESVLPHLTKPEQVAQEIGSVSFEGWRCPKCQPNLTGQGIHLRAYVLNRHRFRTCPTCQELTVEYTSKTLESATQDKEGKCLVTRKCHCCSYVEERVETVPWISSSNRDSSSGDGGGSSWGGDSGGGDSGGFGGGDSGGGGDGGSW
jgi:uncharacterized protein